MTVSVFNIPYRDLRTKEYVMDVRLPSQKYRANEIVDFTLNMGDDNIYRHVASFDTFYQRIDIAGTDLHRIINGCVEDRFFRRILAKYIVQLDHKEGGLSPPPLT